MKKYTVIVLALSGIGNQIFKAGDTVTEENFPSGNCAKLVEQGFLEPVKEVAETPKEKAAREKAEKEAAEAAKAAADEAASK